MLALWRVLIWTTSSAPDRILEAEFETERSVAGGAVMPGWFRTWEGGKVERFPIDA